MALNVDVLKVIVIVEDITPAIALEAFDFAHLLVIVFVHRERTCWA
jgi:hypothetical protein